MSANKETSVVKACPLCGKEAEAANIFGHRNASCTNEACHLSDFWVLIEHWNRRPVEDELQADVQRLHKQIHALANGTAIESDHLCPTDDKLIAALADNERLQRELDEVRRSGEDTEPPPVDRCARCRHTRRAHDNGECFWDGCVCTEFTVRRSGVSAVRVPRSSVSPQSSDGLPVHDPGSSTEPKPTGIGPATTKPEDTRPKCNLGTLGCVRAEDGHIDRRYCCLAYRSDEDGWCLKCFSGKEDHLPQPAPPPPVPDLAQRVANCEEAIRYLKDALREVVDATGEHSPGDEDTCLTRAIDRAWDAVRILNRK